MTKERALHYDVRHTGICAGREAIGAVSMYKLRPKNPDSRFPLHLLDQFLHTVFLQQLVGVVNEEELSAGEAHSVVVPRTKTPITRRFNNAHPPISFQTIPQHTDGIIFRVVIHDNHLHPIREGLLQKCEHALHCRLRAAKIEYDC